MDETRGHWNARQPISARSWVEPDPATALARAINRPCDILEYQNPEAIQQLIDRGRAE